MTTLVEKLQARKRMSRKQRERDRLEEKKIARARKEQSKAIKAGQHERARIKGEVIARTQAGILQRKLRTNSTAADKKASGGKI